MGHGSDHLGDLRGPLGTVHTRVLIRAHESVCGLWAIIDTSRQWHSQVMYLSNPPFEDSINRLLDVVSEQLGYDQNGFIRNGN